MKTISNNSIACSVSLAIGGKGRRSISSASGRNSMAVASEPELDLKNDFIDGLFVDSTNADKSRSGRVILHDDLYRLTAPVASRGSHVH
jgi:hypothetical protein